MKAFRVTGVMPFGSQKRDFTQDVASTTKSTAEHTVLSNLGSRHKVNRKKIKISSIEEINPNDSLDAKVRFHFKQSHATPDSEEE